MAARHDPGKGLTPFILWLHRANREQLSRDPAVIAKHFGVCPDHARGFLRLHGG